MGKLIIDNQEIEAEEEKTILQVAKKLRIEIPTLCYHEALAPYSACRVCLVEVETGGKKRLVTSCTYPAWEGIEVRTNSENVLKARRFIVELLLARCPNVGKIQNLAKDLGIERPRFKIQDKECILCGLCVRVCSEIIGRSVISFINRGINREVETPFKIDSEVCIGCGSCASVCPTGVIKIEDVEGFRKLDTWHTKLELARCRECNRYFTPKAEIDYIKKKIEVAKDFLILCESCKRKRLAKELIEVKQTLK